MSSNIYSARHKQQKVAGDVDQAEMSAIISGPQVFEAGIVDERISGSLEELEATPSSDQGRLQALDLASDTASGEVAKEVARRIRIMGGAYPFKLQHNSITYTASESGFYEFCLAASLAPTITRNPYAEIPRKFERLAADIAKDLYGANAKSLHVGFPRDVAVGKPFKKGMATLAAESLEWVWQPESGLPDNPTNVKDEGLDFVVWTPMPDKRQGSLFVLGQCACGDDWLQKWNDLSLAQIGKWFSPMTRVPAVRAFATPFHVVDGLMHEASREAGLIFDRARLVVIAETVSSAAQKLAWSAQLKPLTELVIKPIAEPVAA